ncbi:hypothetical protein [Rubrobacter indicoceani]|uniref:hypothetical protein n=1 Tax=Rubrobacter indicoceani TaxID=2051957 RepID=UPI000E5B2E01|nr:hypothetical protein [Rubrobacter indicoceani]
MSEDPRCLVVYGPTASGKSDLTDALHDAAGDCEKEPGRKTTILFDSMQVYREIPNLTNQHRRRPAELSGIVSVLDEWSVARHRAAADSLFAEHEHEKAQIILEAGTGLYLNAFLFGFPLAERVPEYIRREAERQVFEAQRPAALSGGRPTNARRAVRTEELKLAGLEDGRGSVWEGGMRVRASVLYLRPDDRSALDRNIASRTGSIVQNGLEEAALLSGYREEAVGKSVLDAIGVREMISVFGGEIPEHEAEKRISARTRRLARRQITWFDKLTRALKDSPNLHSLSVVHDPVNIKHSISRLDDIIRWWTE